MTYKESSFEVASKHNPGLSSMTKLYPKRGEFFANLDTSDSVINLIEKSLRPTLIKRVRITLGRLKQQVKKMMKNLTGGGKKKQIIHPFLKDSQTGFLPAIFSNTVVSFITFRNKQNGWKTYIFEIKIKDEYE